MEATRLSLLWIISTHSKEMGETLCALNGISYSKIEESLLDYEVRNFPEFDEGGEE